MTPVCGGAEIVRERLALMLAQMEQITAAEWAEKYLTLYDPQNQITGPTDFTRYPYIRKPFEACCNPGVKRVAFCWSAQMLKTTVMMMAMAHLIATGKVPVIWATDTRNNAQKFSESRWMPLVEINECLRRLKPANQDKYKVLIQYFTTAAAYFIGVKSSGQVASTPAGIAIRDEMDKYGDYIGKEADPGRLLGERVMGSYNGRLIDGCTPTYYDGPIYQAFLHMDQQLFFVPCPHCREYITMVDFAGLKWDQNARRQDGSWDIERAAASAHYECPKCGGPIHDSDKPAIMRAGDWMATNPHPDEPGMSFRINRLYSTLPSSCFGALCREHLMAGNNPGARQNFSNSWLAEPYEDSSDKHEVAEVLEHLENYPAEPMPRGVLLLTCGVDVQRGREGDPDRPPRLEAELVGWGRGEETWGIEHRVFRCGLGTGAIEDLGPGGVWAKLDEWLMKQRATADGRVLPVSCCLIDSGWCPETVYSFCEGRLGRMVFPCKGRAPGRPGDPLVSLAQKSNVRRVPVHMVSRWTGNLYVLERLKIKEPGPNYLHFPNDPLRGYDQRFFEQLVAERLSKRRVGGQMIARWVDDGKQTEALACRRYACAAFARLNADLDAFARQAEFLFEARQAEENAKKIAGKPDGPQVVAAPVIVAAGDEPIRSNAPIRDGGDFGGFGGDMRGW